MNKKLVMLLVSLMLIFSLAACSGGSGNGNSSNSKNDPVRTNAASEDSSNDSAATNASEGTNDVAEGAGDSKETPEMDFDMGGRVIKIVNFWSLEIPEDNPDNIQRKKNLEALMKKHNFKVEYVVLDQAEYQNKVTASLLAGEPVGDIISLARSYAIPTLVSQDLLWPVDEYTKNDKVFDPNVSNKIMQYKGRGYGFGGYPGGATGFFYNRTLMKNLGMKPLQEYVDEDNWNWETFIQVIKEANKDTNNDGKLDTWGLAGAGFLDSALASNETGLTKEDKQSLDDPRTVEVLNFLSKLSTEKLVRPSEGGDWTEPSQFFRQGNTLLYLSGAYEAEGLKKDMKDFEFGFIPFPKGPNGTSYNTPDSNPWAMVIPKAVENPEQLVYIWEKIETYDSIYNYYLQSWYETLFDNEVDINNVKVASNRFYLDSLASFPSMPYYKFADDINKGQSVSTVIETYKTPFQAAIDEVYKK
ncbi:family 1 extracellular solute-binding protein [Paenibacillus mucilaginosus 3016]|uniref:Family 1 extracellular solute-binding protein n=1 Tax=Paenibacillus mucilaginosus 3016 TaxID=1116391 RepID=H6NNX6_9BACL|nr:extracellular solute-binding protein [Paenibacillus mucilaginosus]AFC30502.1 family 1 extracellular solute-binding protein [Paenibacillus mucilaginosus 3016]WFA19131.1 extracellular solute-binding protein [Paenibacillus mucilaginosus]